MKGSRVSVTDSNGSSENSVNVMNSQPRPYKPNDGPTLRSNDKYLKPTTSASRHSWGNPDRFRVVYRKVIRLRWVRILIRTRIRTRVVTRRKWTIVKQLEGPKLMEKTKI